MAYFIKYKFSQRHMMHDGSYIHINILFIIKYLLSSKRDHIFRIRKKEMKSFSSGNPNIL